MVCTFSDFFPLKQKKFFDKNLLQSFCVEGTKGLVTNSEKETVGLPGISNVVWTGN